MDIFAFIMVIASCMHIPVSKLIKLNSQQTEYQDHMALQENFTKYSRANNCPTQTIPKNWRGRKASKSTFRPASP